jgi:hypothetical protein
MNPAPIPSQSSTEHTTIVTFRRASGDVYCALTIFRREDEQPQCAISRRIGSHEPSFAEAMKYTKANLYPNRKPNSITWTDHQFEILANREILHGFETVRVTDGGVSREKVDLTEHAAWATRVQPAVRLLVVIGA